MPAMLAVPQAAPGPCRGLRKSARLLYKKRPASPPESGTSNKRRKTSASAPAKDPTKSAGKKGTQPTRASKKSRAVDAVDVPVEDTKELLGSVYCFEHAPPAAAEDKQEMAAPAQGNPVRAPVLSAISRAWPSTTHPPRGMKNPSMYCYRLSALQVLTNLPSFYSWITGNHNHPPRAKGTKAEKCIACALQKLVDRYWTPATTASLLNGALTTLHNTVTAIGPGATPPWIDINKDQQADAHEFMVWLVQVLESKGSKPAPEVSALFKLQHQQAWTCPGCNHVHNAPTSVEFSLSVGIEAPRQGLPLADYIDQYYGPDVAGMTCSRCQWTGTARQVITISEAPEILFIQLRRFQVVVKKKGVSIKKLSNSVPFGLWLDISRHNADTTARGPGALRYKLAASISHSGDMTQGHYITYSTTGQGVYCLDDLNVGKVSVQEFLKPGGKFQPYILAYVRTY